VNRFLYCALFYLATPVILLRLLWRSLRAPDYRKRWAERFAFYGDLPLRRVDVVFHTVSVGEVHAAVPLIRKLQAHDPSLEILVTTTTPTGSARVPAMLGDTVQHVYLPYDYPGAVNRFLDRFAPRLLVIMETEWWPNLVHCCAVRGVRLMLANARLSEKSQGNYQRMHKLAGEMLKSFDAVTGQSQHDRDRLVALGLPPAKVEIAGSMKYDMMLNADMLVQARQDKEAMAGRPVLIAASTRTLDGEAEEEKILQAFGTLVAERPDLLLVLVPRHPERFDSVAALAGKRGFSIARRSRDRIALPEQQVLIGDSMGEMQYYFGLADIAFVGGSLVNTGCQNIIEPAAIGLPVITGPSLYNFQAVSEAMIAVQGMLVVANAAELAAVVKSLLDNPSQQQVMGEAARSVVEANQGATARNLAVLSGLLGSAR
jgi:3-deoxy-D-manno-octulosonic-acid transferase